MCSIRQLFSLLTVVATICSGCSSLRPPATDKAVWEEQQWEKVPKIRDGDPANVLYYMVEGAASAASH